MPEQRQAMAEPVAGHRPGTLGRARRSRQNCASLEAGTPDQRDRQPGGRALASWPSSLPAAPHHRDGTTGQTATAAKIRPPLGFTYSPFSLLRLCLRPFEQLTGVLNRLKSRGAVGKR